MLRLTIIDRYRQRIAQGDRMKLSKTELVDLIADFIRKLATLKSKSAIESRCLEEIALLEEGYPQPTVGKVYLPMYRKAIKQAIDSGELPLTKGTSHQYVYVKRAGDSGSTVEHFALTFLKYDTATYSEFAAVSADRNNQKQDHLQAVELEAFLEVATDLLQSENPFDLAAGIAAATGRRFSEVVAKGSFTPSPDPYWLVFDGQLKKRTKANGFRTPCLLPAATILAAVERFRTHPRIVLLAQGTPDELNRSLADSVKRSVQTHFGGIVPILPGEKAVTVHNLRGVYAQICNYYFCPPDRTTTRFLQECLGHVISEQELKRANSAATQFYFHYYLVDRSGHHLSAKGVMLDKSESLACADFSASEEVVVDEDIAQPITTTIRRRTSKRPRAGAEPIDTLAALAMTAGQHQEKLHQQLSLATAPYEQRIAFLENSLQEAHRRIEQLLTLAQQPLPRNSKRRTPATSKILMAIEAIYNWNSQQPQKFAVSQTLLLKATGCNRPAIQQVLADLSEEIDRHHTQFSIAPASQSRNLAAIVQFVQESINDL